MTDVTEETPAVEEQAPVQAEAEQPEEAGEQGLKDLLKAFPDAPTESTIEEWKGTHGEVMCSGFSESELFMFRPLTRGEFVELQVVLAQNQTTETQFAVEEDIVNKCVLWATGNGLKSLQTKGGSLSTLHEQIMQNSNFVNPAMASALVIKL